MELPSSNENDFGGSSPKILLTPTVKVVLFKIFFQQGMARLRTAWEKQLHVALMCSEMKPQECHRSKLIGNALIEQHIAVAHIDELGACKEQQAVNNLLLGGQATLFAELPLVEVNGKVGRARKKVKSFGEST